MGTRLALLVTAVFLTACGSDGSEPLRSAEATADAWVDALNRSDYDRACDLSAAEEGASCETLLEREPFGRNLEIEAFYSDLDDTPGDQPMFTLSSEAERTPEGPGWTAHALQELRIERHGDEYLVRLPRSPASSAS